MKLSAVISNLYSYNLDKIVQTVNSSVYVKDFPFDKEHCLIIHTGFIFKMQNTKEIELFYDFVNDAIIRQPRFSENPPVLGLVYFFWNDWVKVWKHQIVLRVDEMKEEIGLTSFENASDAFEFDEFEVISADSLNNYTINKLTRKLDEKLFFNGDTFEEILEDEDDWQ